MKQKELAAALNVSSTAIGNWLKEGMPCKSPGTRGRAADFDLADVLEWLQVNSKGYSIRRDRPGLTTKVPDHLPSCDLPAGAHLTEGEINATAVQHARKVLRLTLAAIWGNFPIAAAGAIRFAGLEPAAAVDLAFHQMGMVDFVARYTLERSGLEVGPDPEPLPERVQMYLDGKKDELAAVASDLVSLWDDDP